MPLLLADLSSFDYTVVVCYFVGIVWLGYHVSRRQKDTEEYFVVGRRIPSWAAGLSIFAILLRYRATGLPAGLSVVVRGGGLCGHSLFHA